MTDDLPGLALAAEPADPDMMERPPDADQKHVRARAVAPHTLGWRVDRRLSRLPPKPLGSRSGFAHWRSATFTVLTFTQMAQALAIRSERESVFRVGFSRTQGLLGAVALTVCLQFAILYVPLLQTVFRT